MTLTVQFSRAITKPRLGVDLIETLQMIIHRFLVVRASSLIYLTGQPEHDGSMETAAEPSEYWDQTYGHGDTTRSWFQSEPVWSLCMLDRVGIVPGDNVIDVGGGSSPFVAALLARGHSDLTVLDVSIIGMQAAQQRLGTAADQVQWLLGDVRTWQPPRRYVLWHDRALFHF
jgi:hypothetical protein